MVNRLSKRHHYIPRFLIDNWADESGKICVLDQSKKRIFTTSSKNVFTVNHLYSQQRGLSSPKNDSIERDFAKEERRAAVDLRRIIDSVRSESDPRMDLFEVRRVGEFLISLVRRTPESQSRIREQVEDPFLVAISRLPRAKELGLDDPVKLYGDKRVRELKRIVEANVNANFASGTNPRDRSETLRFVRTTGLSVFHVRNPKHSFVLGSLGYCYVKKRTRDGRIECSTWFPIAPDIAISFTNDPFKIVIGFECKSVDERVFVSAANSSIGELSRLIVASDSETLNKMSIQ